MRKTHGTLDKAQANLDWALHDNDGFQLDKFKVSHEKAERAYANAASGASSLVQLGSGKVPVLHAVDAPF